MNPRTATEITTEPRGRRACRLRPLSPAFTLIEMLVATLVAAVLIGSVLFMVAGIGRDRRTLTADEDRPRPERIVELLRRDLANATYLTSGLDGRTVTLLGHGGIDPNSLVPTGRLTRIIYRVTSDRQGSRLYREQEYVDDPRGRQRWTELVATGVNSVWVAAGSGAQSVERAAAVSMGMLPESTAALDARGIPATLIIPARVRVRVELDQTAIDQDLNLR